MATVNGTSTEAMLPGGASPSPSPVPFVPVAYQTTKLEDVVVPADNGTAAVPPQQPNSAKAAGVSVFVVLLMLLVEYLVVH